MDLDMTSIVWFWGTLRRYLSHTIHLKQTKKVCKVSVKFVYFTKLSPSAEMSKGNSNKMSF